VATDIRDIAADHPAGANAKLRATYSHAADAWELHRGVTKFLAGVQDLMRHACRI
jgi:hypothetical protein